MWKSIALRSVFIVTILACPVFVFAGSPSTLILPSDDVLDPTAASTPWGGCEPTDTNCYISVPGASISTSSLTVIGTSTLGTTVASSISSAIAAFGATATSSFNSSGQLQLANLSNALLSTDANGNVVATTSIGTLTAAPSLTVIATSLTGFLKATAGVLSTAFVNLATDVTGILPVANGGTGLSSIASGAVLYGNGSSAVATTPAGTAGQVLAFLNGVPTWTATSTFSAPLSYAGGTVSIPVANGSTNGYLASGDWTSFSNKAASSRLINTSYPLGGGGDLTADRTISLAFGTTTANSWSALQTIAAASSTNLTASNFWVIGQGSGCAQFDANGRITSTGTNCGSGGSGGISWPWTTLTTFGTSTDATTTGAWFEQGLYASSTSQLANATTSNLTVAGSAWLTSLGTPAGTFLAVDQNGKVIATTTSAGGVVAVNATYPLMSTGGATPVLSVAFGTTTANTWSAQNVFTNGFISDASSTIGLGTQNTGLTISGGATTTGNLLVQGNATTSNFYSTTASSSNLFATATNFGSAVVNTLTTTVGNMTNLTAGVVSGTSLNYTYSTTTNLAVYNNASFGGSATSSFNNQGQLTLANINNAILSTNGSGLVVATTSIGAYLLNGVVGIGHGGTGTSTVPTYGQLLIGDSNGNYEFTSTSSLGLIASAGAAYPFQLLGNATSSLTQFNGGLTAYASSTIGNGTAAGGLTVNGTATTSLVVVTGAGTSTVQSGFSVGSFSAAGIATFNTLFSSGLATFANIFTAGSSTLQNFTALTGTTTNIFVTGTASTSVINATNANIATANVNSLSATTSVNVDDNGYYQYGGHDIIEASTTLGNYFIGEGAGSLSMSGIFNTGYGTEALSSNVIGSYNAGYGAGSLLNNTSGDANTGVGFETLLVNQTGYSNTAIGDLALSGSNSGSGNTAVGESSMLSNIIGNDNVAVGEYSLANNANDANTAVGPYALYGNATGTYDTALGILAGYGFGQANRVSVLDSSSTFIGAYASRAPTVSSTTALVEAGAIGYNSQVGCSHCFAIGGTSTDAVDVGIGTSTPVTALQVYGDIRVGNSGSNGCLQNYAGSPIGGTCVSDQSLKTNITPITDVLGQLSQLVPVTYNWNALAQQTFMDNTSVTNYGLVAQQVATAIPSMVATTSSGYLGVDYSRLPILDLEGIRELDTDLDAITSSSSATTTAPSQDFATAFFANLFSRLTSWFADPMNGIGDFYAGHVFANNLTFDRATGNELDVQKVVAQQLCVGTICVTQDEFEAMVAMYENSQSASTSAGSDQGTSSTTATLPVIEINGNNPATVNVGSVYVDLGATITGPQQDLNLGISASVDGGATTTIAAVTIDTSVPGVHQVVYSATDEAGNTATASRTVDVVAPPTTTASTTPLQSASTTPDLSSSSSTSTVLPLEATSSDASDAVTGTTSSDTSSTVDGQTVSSTSTSTSNL